MSPFAIFATAGLLTETVFTFLITLSLYGLVRLYRGAAPRWGLIAASAAATACLTRANGLPFYLLLLVTLVVILLFRRAERSAAGWPVDVGHIER